METCIDFAQFDESLLEEVARAERGANQRVTTCETKIMNPLKHRSLNDRQCNSDSKIDYRHMRINTNTKLKHIARLVDKASFS